MKQAFPSIVDVNFTATMEGLLDCVGGMALCSGRLLYVTSIRI